jgi:hypothetical protein
MKRLVTALAVATPSIASAESSAKALSLSDAAAQPVRAAAPMAKKKLAAVDECRDDRPGALGRRRHHLRDCLRWW